MKKIIFILMLVSFTHQGRAQETNRNQISSAPADSRYEIVQSEFGVRFTLKIDKKIGMVYQLVQDDDEMIWQVVQSLTHTQDKPSTNAVNYQIFTSGLGVRFTFLLNVNTGATWQLTEDKDGVVFWFPLE